MTRYTRKILEIERKVHTKAPLFHALLYKKKSVQSDISSVFHVRVVFGFAASDAFRKLNGISKIQSDDFVQ